MPSPHKLITHPRHHAQRWQHAQRGAVLMVMLVIMVVGSTTVLVNSLNANDLKIARQQQTVAALAKAKDALIGYATAVKLARTCTGNNCARPGDLLCPDTDNDGDAESSCGNADGSTGQAARLGRLPWKTLGIPDLRDGNGERLWYAVSNNYKNNTRSTNILNGDTPGTLTVRDMGGSILYNGLTTTGTGAVALIISPGAVLQRLGATSPQNRSCTIGVNCDATEKCLTSPASSTPKCNPINYLDIANSEDNAAFADSTENGFIQGIIRDNAGNTILNDQLLTITQDDMMYVIQNRVAAEVRQCLVAYAAANNGRYPWPAHVDETFPTYSDKQNNLFGRIPDNLDQTNSTSSTTMNDRWPASCNTHERVDGNNVPAAWWNNWKELVFYGLADAYKPALSGTAFTPCSTAGACLTVNSLSTNANVKFVVIVAGPALSGQVRSTSTDKKTPSNYLEGSNSAGGTVFTDQPSSATFNDVLTSE